MAEGGIELRRRRSPSVTVAVPTYNRSDLLRATVESVLAQDYSDLRLLIVDDGSTDDTAAVVASFDDPRIDYFANETNIGVFRNWTVALGMNRSDYFCILPDDDMYLPGFIERSVEALEACPSAGFSVARCRYVGIDGEPLPEDVRPRRTPVEVSGRCIDGLDWLHHVVEGQSWIYLWPSTVMMRSTELDAAGPFDPRHSKLTFDFNLWNRMARRSDVVFLDRELAVMRIHDGQVSAAYRTTSSPGQVALVAERIEAGLSLLASSRSQRLEYREWLGDRLQQLSSELSQIIADQLPGLNLGWEERVHLACREIGRFVEPGRDFVLIDSDQWGLAEVGASRAIPLVERDGRYWGPPVDDATAIHEVERARSAGATHLVLGWPAFWWLDHYEEFRRHVEERFPCVARNSSVIIFDLTGEPPS